MAAPNESVQKARASRGQDTDAHELPAKKTSGHRPHCLSSPASDYNGYNGLGEA